MGAVAGAIAPCKDYGSGCRCDQCRSYGSSPMSEIVGQTFACKDYHRGCRCRQCEANRQSSNFLEGGTGWPNFNSIGFGLVQFIFRGLSSTRVSQSARAQAVMRVGHESVRH